MLFRKKKEATIDPRVEYKQVEYKQVSRIKPERKQVSRVQPKRQRP